MEDHTWTEFPLDLALRLLSAGVNDLGSLTYDPYEIRLSEVNGRGGLQPATVRSAITKVGRSPSEREPYTIKGLPAAAARKEELVFA